ncbi:hypothetical protein [Nonomuraea jabiensis]|nr:hypothetical protein [Nonomuraea jabiensis]
MEEFVPLNLMPHPGRQWAERSGKRKDPEREPRRRRRATYNRYGGVRHLFAALDLAKDKLYGHIKPVRKRTQLANNVEIAYTRPTAPGSTAQKPSSARRRRSSAWRFPTPWRLRPAPETAGSSPR